MAVVEREPELALLLGTTLDHAGLETTGAADDPLDDVELARQEPRGVALDLLEIGPLENDAVLDDLGQARAKVPLGQRARDGRVPFVLAPSLGAFRVVYDVPPAEVRAAVGELAG